MALIKPIQTEAGITVSYWRIEKEERHYSARGVVIDVTLFAYVSAETFAAGAAPSGAGHSFRLEPDMLVSDDPRRGDIYAALKAHDPFFADATDEISVSRSLPAPPTHPQQTDNSKDPAQP